MIDDSWAPEHLTFELITSVSSTSTANRQHDHWPTWLLIVS